MNNSNVVRKQFLDLLRGGNAHQHFAQATDKFSMALINTKLPGSDYTAWRLLEHMRIAQWDIVEFTRNAQHVSPPWPQGYWPAAGKTADAQDWAQTLAGLHSDLEAMCALVADPHTDLSAPLAHAPEYTVAREALVLADHNAYHLGEFGLLRGIIEAGQTAR